MRRRCEECAHASGRLAWSSPRAVLCPRSSCISLPPFCHMIMGPATITSVEFGGRKVPMKKEEPDIGHRGGRWQMALTQSELGPGSERTRCSSESAEMELRVD